MKIQKIRHGAALSAVALSVALLQACGGGGGSASTGGSTVSPTLNGTVTGFGSVMVDGQEIEDAYAQVAHENADGSTSNDVLQMGQRVRVVHDGAGKASQVLIDAAVIGKVSSINTTANTLVVAGQVVSVNASSAAGPVTVFGGGYTDLTSVSVDDLVQVHGTPVYSNGSYTVQATRIQKDTGVVRVQVNGKIAAYASTATGATFTLNGLTVNTTSATAVRPTGSALANDMQVTAYGSGLSSGVLTASNIRINREQNSGSTTMQAQLSGAVSNYNASAGTFELQGTTVKLGTATVQPTGANVANNAYVLVKGSVGSDGSITATQITVRTADTTSDLAKVLLIGAISDYVDNSSFVVRGVPVDASAINFTSACPNVTVANNLTVRVQATQQTGTAVVKATSITCRPVTTTQIIRPVEGTVASVDSTGKTFSLTVGSATQQVKWTDTTTFAGVTADTLSGKSVHVEGYLDTNGTALVARVVQLDDNSTGAPVMDDHEFRRSGQGSQQTSGWQQYRTRH